MSKVVDCRRPQPSYGEATAVVVKRNRPWHPPYRLPWQRRITELARVNQLKGYLGGQKVRSGSKGEKWWHRQSGSEIDQEQIARAEWTKTGD